MTTQSSKKPDGLSVAFGHRYLLGRLETRLRQSLTDAGMAHSLEPALVAGVFGEWGSGKSHLIKAAGERVRAWEPVDGELNVVVEFNAWRYEREEHLLIPLLKVAQKTLEKALEDDIAKRYPDVRSREVLKDRAFLLADLCQSIYTHGGKELLKMGVSLVTGVPLLSMLTVLGAADGSGEVDEDADVDLTPEEAEPKADGSGKSSENEAAWRRWQRLKKEREKARKTQLPLQQLESLYFNFLEHLSKVTGRNPEYLQPHRERLAQGWIFSGKPEDLRVNLIFLVDDLDRCLPDKAVEVLEAIKLFLEVPGCAFVLALDEEVVERGIAHRYRDYALQGKAGLTPITGAEYLEKLVHLPIRLPRPSRLEARAHLANRVPEWFRSPQNGLSNELAELVANLTPPVPRKLHRMAELLQLADGMLETESHRLGVDASTRRRWLALVCALQLFAPALFRYLRVHGADLLMTLVEWRTSGELRDLDALRLKLTEARKKAERPEALAYQMKLERLPDLVEAALHNRSGFDLLEVLGRAARLREERQLEETALGAVFSFVLLAEEETPPEGWKPSTEERRIQPESDIQPTDADGVNPLGHLLHPGDYTLPRYARLENAFALDEAVRGGDVTVLKNVLSVQGTNLLGRLLPDDMVAGWCAEGKLPWLVPGAELSAQALELLRLLEPHLSQWAALRLGWTFGWAPILRALRRMGWTLGWQEVERSAGQVGLDVKVPGIKAPPVSHLLRLRLPLRPPLGDSSAEQAVRAWRRPMGAHTHSLTLDGSGSSFLGVDEYGLFADLRFNGVMQRFRYLPPGEFMMGSPDEEGGDVDERPSHLVKLTEGFWLADTPCTHALWLAVTGGESPSKFHFDEEEPVEKVSWFDVMNRFIPPLNASLPADCRATLPSEAQWEYACRAGTQTVYVWGDQVERDLANIERTLDSQTPVKHFPANPWGLFDMHGNVREWCLDGKRTYTGDVIDPLGMVGDGPRVLRGGSRIEGAWFARSACREQNDRSREDVCAGFRVALRFK